MRHEGTTSCESERQVERIVNSFSLLAIALIVFVTVSFVIFFLTDSLTLTILTNNFALMIGAATLNNFLMRIQKMKSNIAIDQHKAVIYESSYLLRHAVEGRRVPSQYTDKLLSESILFMDALQQTELFLEPLHIQISRPIQGSF